MDAVLFWCCVFGLLNLYGACIDEGVRLNDPTWAFRRMWSIPMYAGAAFRFDPVRD